MTKSSLALSNLRAVVIVIVLAFHSALAYLASAPAQQSGFEQPPYSWQAFPIVDGHRWIGFDIFCAWQDVSLMALMFFLSGLLTAGSLNRKGSRAYCSGRLTRIGIPFALVVLFLSPLSFYPAYLARTAEPSVLNYWHEWLALPFWPAGPEWFLWQLLVLNLLAGAVYAIWPACIDWFARFAAEAARKPLKYGAWFAAASVLAYAPLALGFTPWRWAAAGPFSLQLCRPLLYLVYFFGGVALGSYGIDRGLLSVDGPLVRNWRAVTAAAVTMFLVWAAFTSLTRPDWNAAPLAFRIIASLTFPLACASGGLFLIASCLRFTCSVRLATLDSLSGNAYGMYLIHYAFVVWLQYLLLPTGLNAATKFAIVLAGALSLSWSTSVVFARALAATQVFAVRRTVASAPR